MSFVSGEGAPVIDILHMAWQLLNRFVYRIPHSCMLVRKMQDHNCL